jgi:hypothetical protein
VTSEEVHSVVRDLFHDLYQKMHERGPLVSKWDGSHLKITEPDLRIQDGERQNMVDEGFRFPSQRRDAKYLRGPNIHKRTDNKLQDGVYPLT